MTFTANETAWMVMAVTLAVTLTYSTLQTWIVIKLQTSKDIAKTKDEIKKSFVRFFILAANIFAALSLGLQLISSNPISRADVFSIIFDFIILFTSALIKMTQAFFDIHIKQLNHTTEQLELLTKFINTSSAEREKTHAELNSLLARMTTKEKTAQNNCLHSDAE